MNFEPTSPSNTNGTQFQGYVTTSVAHLTNIFGEPIQRTAESETTHEWNIEIEDPDSGELLYATIYDYWFSVKPTPYSTEQWHIGGTNRQVAHLVRLIVEEKYDPNKR